MIDSIDVKLSKYSLLRNYHKSIMIWENKNKNYAQK